MGSITVYLVMKSEMQKLVNEITLEKYFSFRKLFH